MHRKNKNLSVLLAVTYPLIIGGICEKQAFGASRMISYQYTKCVDCHISPQGRWLLTEYGSGVDESQSFRAAEIGLSKNEIVRFLNAQGRVSHDIRTNITYARPLKDKVDTMSLLVNYRNSTQILKKHRVALNVGVELPKKGNSFSPSYYSPTSRPKVYLSKLYYAYRPSEYLELSVGRDYLPVGINTSDLKSFIRSRNRQEFSNYPTQLKLFWWGKKALLSAYSYGPSGQESNDQQEYGFGTLLESDIWKNRLVLGVSGQFGASNQLNREVFGIYTRLGVTQSFGIQSEIDLTLRQLKIPNDTNFAQLASYTKVHWTPWEWFVVSLVYQNLFVARPFQEQAHSLAMAFASRWTSNFSTSFSLSKTISDASAAVFTGKVFVKL